MSKTLENYRQWRTKHRIASYYIDSTFWGLFMYFVIPLVTMLIHHQPYQLKPLVFIFLYLWFGFAWTFTMEVWQKKVRARTGQTK
ncbi:MAG: hypothetical protein J5711_02930 [Bacteroidales bacterium]|nr:hypothetical protein [Bacteroidales bacterium]